MGINKNKVDNFEKVRNIIKNAEKDTFCNYDIVKKTGMHYNQVKRILTGICELGEIKFIEANNLYVRIEVNN
jgi:hypothetical protein